MGNKTGISWTEKTWNPAVGCALVSPSCTHCYAMAEAHRISAQGGKAGAKYEGLTHVVNGRPVWNGVVRMAGPEVLDQPRRWTKPSVIFVNSMSDVFHEALSDAEIFSILDVQHNVSRHIYQNLTKRHDRMVEVGHRWLNARGLDRFPDHMWMGMSIEDQKRLDERTPFIAVLRAGVKWFSCEPLLGRIDVAPALAAGVSWVVVGGESITWERRVAGEHARIFDVAWAREIRDVCAAHGAAYHFKQLGENPVGAARTTSKGDTIEEWPEDLRIQEYPKEIAWLERQAVLPGLAV